MQRLYSHISSLLLKSGLSLIGLLIVFSCEKEVKKGTFIDSNELNISSYLFEKEEYSYFIQLLEKSNLFDALNSYNPYGSGFTVFVPTNEAFQNYISENDKYSSFDELANDTEFLNILVRFHIVLSSYNTNDFPFGALNDSTITGDYLSIGFQTEGGEGVYLINNYSKVVTPNILLSNGIVHVLSTVLEPITLSSFDWLKTQDGSSIFIELLEQTGWADSMGITKFNTKGRLTRNRYTLFVEPDSVFQKRGIESFQELVQAVGDENLPYNDANNGVFQFAAYHLLEQVMFLDDMEDGIYNSFTYLPVQITSGSEIKINLGYKLLGSLYTNGDIVKQDYVPLIYSLGNNPTKNGPVHYISELLELFKPAPGINTYHFKSEPIINELAGAEGRFVFEDPNEFEVLNWSGTDRMVYVSGIEAVDAWEDDYLELNGPFTFTFTSPRIFPGKYNFKVRIHSADYANAVIQIYLDGKRVGTNINLKSTSGKDPFVLFTVGSVDFLDYASHKITINTVIPGKLKLDMIRFEP